MNSKVKVAPPDSPMYNWSDPKRVGPGVWYMFMLMSCHAQDKAEKAWVCAQIRLFCDYFKCGDCSGHCKRYVDENPPEEALKGDYALFDWVVTFMNAVNKRLGKPIYDRDILLRTFTKTEFKFCDANCDKDKASAHSRAESRSPRYSVPRSTRSLTENPGMTTRRTFAQPAPAAAPRPYPRGIVPVPGSRGYAPQGARSSLRMGRI